MTQLRKAVLIDLDGTVVHGGSLLEGAASGINAIKEAGLAVLFLTNNPTRSPGGWADHLTELGVPVEPNEVLTSAIATVQHLNEHYASHRVLPIAGPAVIEQLQVADVAIVDDPAEADVVVAGYHEGFDFDELTQGLRAVLNGADLVGTDPDRWIPTTEGPIPGSGAVCNAIAGAAEVEPVAILGKPSQETIDLATRRLSVPGEHCLMVGDRLNTDVAMGEQAGMETALVLTGAASRGDVETSPIEPDHVLESLEEIDGLLDSA